MEHERMDDHRDRDRHLHRDGGRGVGDTLVRDARLAVGSPCGPSQEGPFRLLGTER